MKNLPDNWSRIIKVADEVLAKMPKWQQDYAKEIVESATSDKDAVLPKMLG